MSTSHGSNADVVGNGYILSGFLKNASFSGKRDTAETTTFKKGVKTFIPGLKDTNMTLDGIWDGVVDAIDDILWKAFAAGKGVFSYIPEGYEVVGRKAWSMDAISTKFDVNTAIGDVAQISAELAMGDTGFFTRGLVSHPMANEAAPGSGTAINNGAASAFGGALIIHATDVSALLICSLQDSADGVTYADLTGTIAVVSATRTSARLVYTGIIRQYTRVVWTGTGTFLAITDRYTA